MFLFNKFYKKQKTQNNQKKVTHPRKNSHSFYESFFYFHKIFLEKNVFYIIESNNTYSLKIKKIKKLASDGFEPPTSWL